MAANPHPKKTSEADRARLPVGFARLHGHSMFQAPPPQRGKKKLNNVVPGQMVLNMGSGHGWGLQSPSTGAAAADTTSTRTKSAKNEQVRKKAGTSRKARKRKPGDSEGEEVGYSDQEEAEEDDVRQSDDDMIDDGDVDDEPMMHAGLDHQETMATQNREQGMNAAQQYQAGILAVRSQGRQFQANAPEFARDRTNLGDDEPPQKRSRSIKTVMMLQSLPERGMGGIDGMPEEYDIKAPYLLGDKMKVAMRLVSPWKQQPGRALRNGQVVYGSFGNTAHADWLNDPVKEKTFASFFAVPMDETIPLNHVASDVYRLDNVCAPLVMKSMSTAKILHCIYTTHPPLELTRCHEPLIERTFVGLPKQSRELQLAMNQGPFGGVQAKADCVLYMFSQGEGAEITNTEPIMLQLLELICELLKGSSGVELWPSVSTQYTDVFVNGHKGKSKVQSGATMQWPYSHADASQRHTACTTDDIDKRLLEKLYTYRYDQDVPWDDEEKLNKLVHPQYKLNNVQMAGQNIKTETLTVTEPNLCDIFLMKEVVTGLNVTTNNPTMVGVDAIYIKPKFPAMDPLIMLENMGKHPTRGTKFQELLGLVLRHMNTVQQNPSCSYDDMFHTDKARAATLVSEMRMVEGFFRFCDTQKIVNVNLGGMRYDLHNPLQQKAWNEHMKFVNESRRRHYQLLRSFTLQDRASARDSKMPVSDWSLDLYTGVNYRKVPTSDLRDAIANSAPRGNKKKEAKGGDDATEAKEEREEYQTRLTSWLASQINDNDYTYLPEGEGCARNFGIWFKICTETKASEDEERRDADAKKQQITFRMVQPGQSMSLVRLFLAHATSVDDPLDQFIDGSWVPDKEWLEANMVKQYQVSAISYLKEAIGDCVNTTSMHVPRVQDASKEELLGFVNKRKHTLPTDLLMLQKNCSVETLHRAVLQKLNAVVNLELHKMAANQLLMQWALAAESIKDLKRHNNHDVVWLEDFKNLERYTVKYKVQKAFNAFLNPTTLLSEWTAMSRERLDADLSWQNTILIHVDRLCVMAHCWCMDAYGMTLRIMDCKGAIVLLIHDHKTGHIRKHLIDVKYPGMGWDTAKKRKGQEDNAYWLYLSILAVLRDSIDLNTDIEVLQISKMALMLLLGRGTFTDGTGAFLHKNGKFTRECGTTGYFSELGKAGDGVEQIQWTEANLAQSGGADASNNGGTKRQTYSTTDQGKEKDNIEFRNGLPITAITGNISMPGAPASAPDGGRWMQWPSSCQDGLNGVYRVLEVALEDDNKIFKMASAKLWNDMDPEEQAQFETAHMNAVLAHHFCMGDVRGDIRSMNSNVAMKNRLYCLLLQWQRKDFTLLASSMSLDVYPYDYTMRSGVQNWESAVEKLTAGLRVKFLKAGTVWHRNAAGPWQRGLLKTQHVTNVMGISLLQHMQRVSFGHPLDLFSTFQNAVRVSWLQPMPVMSILTSLYLWLYGSVLDPSVMIACSFMYHFTRFQGMCSLRILSLVMTGHFDDLDESEVHAYCKLCEHLMPLLLDKAPKDVAPNASGGKAVRKGTIVPPMKEALDQWASYYHDNVQDSIRTSFNSRVQGSFNQQRSVYLTTRLNFVCSEYIKGIGRDPRNNAYAENNLVFGTVSRGLASMFARCHTMSSQNERVVSGVDMAAHESTIKFWTNVVTGCAFPTPHDSTNESTRLKFESPQETGIWWDGVFESAGACSGIVQAFLLQSNLPSNITHHEFFTILLQPYLNYKKLDKQTHMVYGGSQSTGCDKHAWKTKVLDSTMNMFTWSSLPHITPQSEIKGVEVNMCMNLVHYVLMQGLGLTRDWSTEKHENTSYVSSTHNRNLAHMAGGLCSLLMHTSVDISLIPSTYNYKMLLPIPSPEFNSTEAVQIDFDHRIHTDSMQRPPKSGDATDNKKRENVLTTCARLTGSMNWKLVLLSTNKAAMLVNSVSKNTTFEGNMHVTFNNMAEYFMWPPEAVAHMIHHVSPVKNVTRRFELDNGKLSAINRQDQDEHVPKFEHLFALAMLAYGRSNLTSDDLLHEQITLTHCVTQPGRKIPCVSYQTGFMFTVEFDIDGTFKITPTHLTNQWPLATKYRYNDYLSPFGYFRLSEDIPTLPSHHFFDVMTYGLVQHKNDIEVECVTVNLKPNDAIKYPSYMFPVEHFPRLVVLSHDALVKFVEINDRLCRVEIRTNLNFLQRHQDAYVFEDCTEVWTESFPDLTCKVYAYYESTMKDDHELWTTKCPSLDQSPIGFWILEDSVYYHYNCSNELESQITIHKSAKHLNQPLFTPNSEVYYMAELVDFTNKRFPMAVVTCIDTAEDSDAKCAIAFCKYENHQMELSSLQVQLTCELQWTNPHTKPIIAYNADTRSWIGNNTDAESNLNYQNEQDSHQERLNVLRELYQQKKDLVDAGILVSQTELFSLQLSSLFADCVEHLGPVANLRYSNADDVRFGLTKEHSDGQFLSGDGKYCVQTIDTKDDNVAQNFDFITCSRMLVPEGTQLWLRITPEVYKNIQLALRAQGYSACMPVDDVGDGQSRVLRCFYVLGGSAYTGGFKDSHIHIALSLLKTSFLKKKCSHTTRQNSIITMQNTAGDDEEVNQDVDNKYVDLVIIDVHVYMHGNQTLTFDKSDASWYNHMYQVPKSH